MPCQPQAVRSVECYQGSSDMRARAAILILVLCLSATAPAATLTVYSSEWGGASVTEIQILLRNVQKTFYGTLARPPTNNVQVWRGHGDPLITDRQSPREPLRIYLDANGRYWAQFSYQFAHELCHLVCDSDRFQTDTDQPHPWMWFQETLCETASLFTLRRMAEGWKKNPPSPNWKDYAPHLRNYAQVRLDDSQRQLPTGMRLADWYAANRFVLATNATLRPLNGVVANRLLSIFEANPRAWRAVQYLPVTRGTMTQYFQAWLAQTPRQYTSVVRSIAREFQVAL